MVKLFSHSFYAITCENHEQSAIRPMSVNLAVLRIAIVVRIPAQGNGILTILRTSENQVLLSFQIFFMRYMGALITQFYNKVSQRRSNATQRRSNASSSNFVGHMTKLESGQIYMIGFTLSM